MFYQKTYTTGNRYKLIFIQQIYKCICLYIYMIISNIIFIHYPKNMGSSIEYFLLKNLIKNKKEFLDKNMQYEYKKLHNYNENEFKQNFISTHHQPLSYYISFLVKNNLDINKYKIFMIVRNPYSNIISKYKHFVYRKQFNGTINDFITKKKFLNNKIYPHFGKRAVDFIDYPDINIDIKFLKYEDIDSISNYLYHELKIDDNINNYNYNKSNDNLKNNNKYNIDITDLSKKSIDIINKFFKKDFEKFGYKMIL